MASLPGIPERIEGTLDGVVGGQVSGWARDPVKPEETLEIEILIDDEVVGRTLCDHFRLDLAAAGVGSGRHGFVLPIGRDWNDGVVHDVRARATGTDLELDQSPLSFVAGGARAANGRQPARPGPFAADTVLAREGSLDALRARVARRGRLVVLAVHQRARVLPSHVRTYLEALGGLDAGVLVVDTTDGGVPIAPELAPLVLRRANTGWDVASWLAGIHEARGLLADLDELVLANDSVFGPVHDLRESWEHERVRDADFWGITDSWQIGYHLQSYFLVLRRTALSHPAFWAFLERYPFPLAKRQVVRDGEIGLSSALLAAGLRCAATCPYEAVARRWLDDLGDRLARVRAYPENAVLDGAALEAAIGGRVAGQTLRHVLETATQIRLGIAHNPTHTFWDTLVRDFRAPFVKRELLLLNPAEIPYATDVRALLERHTGYDPAHITGAARLVRGSRVPLV
jgi:hypothetical protein